MKIAAETVAAVWPINADANTAAEGKERDAASPALNPRAALAEPLPITTDDAAVSNRLTNRNAAPSWMQREATEDNPAAAIAALICAVMVFAVAAGPSGTFALPEVMAAPVPSVKVTLTGNPSMVNENTLVSGVNNAVG